MVIFVLQIYGLNIRFSASKLITTWNEFLFYACDLTTNDTKNTILFQAYSGTCNMRQTTDERPLLQYGPTFTDERPLLQYVSTFLYIYTSDERPLYIYI